MGTILTKHDFRINNTDHSKNYLSKKIEESGNISNAQSTFQLPSLSKPTNFPLIANGNGTLNLPALETQLKPKNLSPRLSVMGTTIDNEIRVWIVRVILEGGILRVIFESEILWVILEGG